ncbi:hypothetical protein [Rhodoplanes roseus]|uniref:Uncharacterized protein n=1 Tax=Rhodoplanes roseus TaxID=29409 RepID=A0A327L2J1_9BRAD|nr:hypothetical protein [Rhodoplanes roseus]RAI44691.1 hypothetical protein CH341_07695 [Rhodoplanes roseus]
MADHVGLTSGDVLTWWVTIFGSGTGGAVLVAWITVLRARAEARRNPAVLPAESRTAIGAGLAERHVVEQLDRLHGELGEAARAIERMFAANGRHHGETSDRLNRLADRIERSIDEGRETRRAVEDLRARLEDGEH